MSKDEKKKEKTSILDVGVEAIFKHGFDALSSEDKANMFTYVVDVIEARSFAILGTIGERYGLKWMGLYLKKTFIGRKSIDWKSSEFVAKAMEAIASAGGEAEKQRGLTNKIVSLFGGK